VGRVVGVDLGTKRIGFAVSDPDRIIATAAKVVECRSEKEIMAAVLAFVREAGADLCVLGNPINMDGSRGPAAQRVQKFKDDLSAQITVPVVLWDERLSTKSAHDYLIEAGTRREKRKGLVDKIAAQVMLQHYLDAHSV